MMKIIKSLLLIIFMGVNFSTYCQSKEKVTVKIDAQYGRYTIMSSVTGWTFGGSVGEKLSNVKRSSGSDALVAYNSVSFTGKSNSDYPGSWK